MADEEESEAGSKGERRLSEGTGESHTKYSRESTVASPERGEGELRSVGPTGEEEDHFKTEGSNRRAVSGSVLIIVIQVGPTQEGVS